MDLTIDEIVDLLDLTETLICVVDRDGHALFTSAALQEFAGTNAPLAHTGPLNLRGRIYLVEHRPMPGRPGATLRIARLGSAIIQSRELELRSQTLNALVHAAPVAILVLDLQMQVTMWNPACERIFGWSRAEVIGQSYPLVPSDEWDRFEGFFASVIGGQGFASVEAERARKDGKRIQIAISTAPIQDIEGEVIGAMAILEDISERKMLQARHQQATRMEAIGQLAGGVAHDFNNVLTVILAYSDMLLMDAGEGRVANSAGAIKRAAERAAELTRQLLAFGRRQVLQTQVINLNQTVLESRDLLQRLIGADIFIEIRLEASPTWVRADPAQIERLLINLAANARDAMPDGGSLTIATRTIQQRNSSMLADGAWIELAVTDTGEGMDASTMEHIFEPFFTTKPVGKGTGLRLSSVYGVVRQSGGEVDVTSSSEGTTFLISLPEVQPGEIEQPEESPPASPRRAATILLAEDAPDVRAVIRTTLVSEGYTVIEAAHGQQALDRAAAHDGTIDLLLTDAIMPGMGGSELASRITVLRPGIPVLYVSGYTDDEVVRRGAERGAHFIQKPFTAATLVDTVGQVLDKKHALSILRLMRVNVSPSVSLSFRTDGTGPKTLILLHGWMTSSVVWDAVLPHLRSTERRIVLPDLRGAGASTPANSYRIEDYVSDLLALVHALDLTDFQLVGHSMGGQIAQVFAAENPELLSRLILLNPVPAAGLPVPEPVAALFASSAGDRDKQNAILDMACKSLSEPALVEMLDDAASVHAKAMTESLAAWTAGGFADRLAKIRTPTDVIATSDVFLPPAFLRRAVVDPIAGATLHILEGPGHYPQVEAPAATAALLNELLSQ
ncbi:MAG: alpha/beta fold hydrolase [Rhodobacterales bacterium]|nr:alpha/beta fold hydrolase [Rhodobacterales bacterium]